MGANTSHEPLGADPNRVGGGGGAKPHSPGNLFNPYGRASLRKSLRRRKSKRKQKQKENQKDETSGQQVEGPSEAHVRKMDKLRKSFRDSFRKKKEVPVPESSKPHLWQSDDTEVRAGTCSFLVKYMGCVEVYESRGMQVCEEALKVLRNSRRRPVRGILYVSGDGLRVVDDETKGLLVDQTIEKVSFCAPDRNHERGFSYICRDGTTRRWMCHGFIAVKETGERLSHAVGCAFAACLERKQKRDKECGVTMSFDQATSTFTRMGSFRQMSVTERLSDPQEYPVPVKKVDNPHAIARPHATPQLLLRQGSFRGFNHLNQSSPFKRQLSLRLSDLPSNIERTKSLSLETTNFGDNNDNINNNNNNNNNMPPAVAPIPETAPLTDSPSIASAGVVKPDAVSAMCQQVSVGLSLLTNFSDDVSGGGALSGLGGASPFSMCSSTSRSVSPPAVSSSTSAAEDAVFSSAAEDRSKPPPGGLTRGFSRGEEWLSKINSQATIESPSGINPTKKTPPLGQLRSASLGAYPVTETSGGSHPYPPNGELTPLNYSTSFAPSLTNGSSPTTVGMATTGGNHPFVKPQPPSNDPFDAEWASLSSPAGVHNPNNPFLQNTVTKAFHVQM